MNDKFLNAKINAAFPAEYFMEPKIDELVEEYGEEGFDVNKNVKTLYLRQDTSDPNSRRAAGTKNENPLLLKNNKFLVTDVFPSTKVYNAAINGDLPNIDFIESADLNAYIEQNKY